ncbi:major facilitator superfamily domain-containing protein [Collybia nuda]|uniref:Major facilitator superfamily domain-containing protein n=1 Tax=Collybia nuda TaxID=64659 RepID=A0A9P5Y6C4_9AGAR|nr:major facilitator superfamily domain-containing protein [Collybia nuda]
MAPCPTSQKRFDVLVPHDNMKSVDKSSSVEDRKLLRKIDVRLLPILTLLYLLSFLDRTNIGNARIVGLAKDLEITVSEYNTSLALYFVAYVIFEIPANVSLSNSSLKNLNPQIWLPTLALLWGIASVCQGLVVNKAGLFGIRFLLGVTEAGLFPGVIFLFSVYYRRHERSWRIAIFFAGAALAGAFGGILAFAIGKMDGIGGRKGWEWIFIIEGVLTIFVSLIAYFLVPTWSHKAKFLTEPERERLLARLRADSDAGNVEKFDWFFVRQAFKDHLVWGYAMLFHGFAFALYSLSLFMPTIIASLGFQSWQAQLMTVPPNILASISICATVWSSARFNIRAPFIVGAAGVAIMGYVILLASKTAGAQYIGVHFAAAGVYTGNALLLSWPGENVAGQTKRAVAVAMQITIGDIGAITGLSGYLFRIPHLITIGYLVFAALVTTYLSIWMSRENDRRDFIARSQKDNPEPSLMQNGSRLGDRDIHYRYVYRI